MPGCVLRASGRCFDVDGFLQQSTLQACASFRKGQARVAGGRRISDSDGLNVEVSTADGDHVPLQIQEAAEFLKANREELRRLVAWPGVEEVQLDFGWDFPYQRTVAQFQFFSPQFLRECGGLGIGMEISVYAAADGE